MASKEGGIRSDEALKGIMETEALVLFLAACMFFVIGAAVKGVTRR